MKKITQPTNGLTVLYQIIFGLSTLFCIFFDIIFTIMKGFGRKLKELRTEKGLSQLALSKIIDITQSSIARYELEETEPKLSEIEKICTFFEISADYFIGLEDESGTKKQNINQTFNFKF